MQLWIGNIAPGTSDDDLRGLLTKYGGGEVVAIRHVPGDGSRPAALLDVAATPASLRQLTQRLNGMHWKGRSLVVQTLLGERE
jgi:hypothetical protein